MLVFKGGGAGRLKDGAKDGGTKGHEKLRIELRFGIFVLDCPFQQLSFRDLFQVRIFRVTAGHPPIRLRRPEQVSDGYRFLMQKSGNSIQIWKLTVFAVYSLQ